MIFNSESGSTPTPIGLFAMILQIGEARLDLPDMVDEILEHIHHVRRNIVEGDGRITAASSSIGLRFNCFSYSSIDLIGAKYGLLPRGICCMTHTQHLSCLYLSSKDSQGEKWNSLRGMRCSLGFQIINLARPPESRESPTLTFSLVRHCPGQKCQYCTNDFLSIRSHPSWHPLHPTWSLRPSKLSSP